VSALVILSLALVVFALGMVGVAVVVLLRAVRALTAAGQEAKERLAPLAEELQAEQAVTALELEALQETLAQGRERDQRTDGGRGAVRS
jgi:Zn-dependent alcohol dehydrogenase